MNFQQLHQFVKGCDHIQVGQNEQGLFWIAGWTNEEDTYVDYDQQELVKESPIELRAKNVLYMDPWTIVLWNDGTMTTVRVAPNDTFNEEYGVAMAMVKRVYGNRSEFLRDVESGRNLLDG